MLLLLVEKLNAIRVQIDFLFLYHAYVNCNTRLSIRGYTTSSHKNFAVGKLAEATKIQIMLE